MTVEPGFLKRLPDLEKRRLAQLSESTVEPTVPATGGDDLVPTAEDRITDLDKVLTYEVEKIDILDAYVKFTGKPRPKVRSGQRESIKIYCPLHEDKTPSSSINLDKQTFACHHDNVSGGDIYTLGAIYFGYPVENKQYQKGENFPNLKRDILGAFGYSFVSAPGSKELYPVKDDESEEEIVASASEPAPEAAPKLASVTVMPGSEEDEESQNEAMLSLLPPVPWQDFAVPGTWLHQWMSITTQDDSPNEYHFGHGLLALALVAGLNTRLNTHDQLNPVKLVPANLFVCLLGPPNAGKSISKRYLETLIENNIPYKVLDPVTNETTGVRMLGEPASGEVLIKQFSNPVYDPSSTSKNPAPVYFQSVTGLVEFAELENLMKRVRRDSSVLGGTLIQIYDCNRRLFSNAITTGEKEAHDPYGSLITTTQPKSLPRLLSSSEASSGFLSRWFFLPGKLKPRDDFGSGTTMDISSTYDEYQKIRGFCGQFSLKNPIGMMSDARAHASQFYRDVLRKDQARDERDILNRLDFLFKKLLLLVAINEKQKLLEIEHVDRVIKLYPYILATYGIAGDRIGETQYDEIKNAILSVLTKQRQAGKKDLPLRDIKRSLARRNYQDKDLFAALKLLIDLQYIEQITTPKGQLGRPTTKYRLTADE
jgi:hypothetical protein